MQGTSSIRCSEERHEENTEGKRENAMDLNTIPLSRSIKQILMMLADAFMIVTALAFSFALLGKDFFGQDQRFYF